MQELFQPDGGAGFPTLNITRTGITRSYWKVKQCNHCNDTNFHEVHTLLWEEGPQLMSPCLNVWYLCTFALFNNCMIANRRAVSEGAFSPWWRYQPHHSQYYKSRDHKSRDHKILLERETMQWRRKSHLYVAFVTFSSACKCNSTVTITLLSLVIDFLGKYWETWYVQFHRRRCQQTQIWGAIQRQEGCTSSIGCIAIRPFHPIGKLADWWLKEYWKWKNEVFSNSSGSIIVPC